MIELIMILITQQSKALRTRIKTPNFKKNMRLDIVGFGVFEDLNR